ncbi:hypothetical protein SAMN05444285_11659 [Draconibacterium orientale]|jgi:uncharacterized protein YqgC (DUF456 family)|uniref:Membrane protein n=1 Tax=Draconibacterium orientale TaxID=1168034 RepID=X5DDS1_9BACT|nr:DUF456 domain-containing protein [Draconibacterium orientale]AHW61018.1 membrane protein [Draconibacterium orientale]SET56487.1 hypothetical protein SAMN05444285_11659 [Draconibacterium orientale]
MDILLIVLGALFIISGVLGCVLPIIPGPPLSYIGLLLLHFTERYQFSSKFLIIWAVITVVVYALDYLIPAWGTKKFGGSKRGVWGSIIGLVIGMFFFPPFGIIIGPFVGAVVGELTVGKDSGAALKSGFGSFMGFLAGTLLKLIASGMMTWYFVKEMIV